MYHFSNIILHIAWFSCEYERINYYVHRHYYFGTLLIGHYNSISLHLFAPLPLFLFTGNNTKSRERRVCVTWHAALGIFI